VSRPALLPAGAAATAVLLLTSGCTGTSRPPARLAAAAFAAAMSSDHLTGVRYTNSTPQQAQRWWDQVRDGMGTAPVSVTVGSVRENGNLATARLTSSWKLPGDRTWTFPSTLHLRFAKSHWALVLSPDGPAGDPQAGTHLHLRLRLDLGKPAGPLATYGGGAMDLATVWLLGRGLAERVGGLTR